MRLSFTSDGQSRPGPPQSVAGFFGMFLQPLSHCRVVSQLAQRVRELYAKVSSKRLVLVCMMFLSTCLLTPALVSELFSNWRGFSPPALPFFGRRIVSLSLLRFLSSVLAIMGSLSRCEYVKSACPCQFLSCPLSRPQFSDDPGRVGRPPFWSSESVFIFRLHNLLSPTSFELVVLLP